MVANIEKHVVRLLTTQNYCLFISYLLAHPTGFEPVTSAFGG